MDEILNALGITTINQGACAGSTTAWLKSTNKNLISSINPANEKTIAQVQVASEKNYHQLIQSARNAFLQWRDVPAPRRGELIRLIVDKLRVKKNALGKLVTLEMGKSLQEGLGEVQEMIDMADFAIGQSRMLYGNTMHSERPQHRMYEQWYPLGIVGVITAFNFPVAVWSWNAFLAAICGDIVIWKPSSKTPLCAIAVQNICNEAMAEFGVSGVFNLFITDDNQLAEKMVNDKNINLISFTGSTAVGQKINHLVANRFGRCLLECSGNNAIIVDETADLKLALPAIVFGAVGTAGQRCTTTRRLIVHKSRYKKIVEQLIHIYKQIQIGDPLNSKNIVGPLIDKNAIKNYTKAIVAVKKAGGEILFGGNILKIKGYYVEPTIVRAENHWPIVQEETFAPILFIMTYENFDDAITLQNNVPQGLSSALFTQQLQHAERFLSVQGSDCGIANINIGTSGAEIGGAFGGEKETGGGREAGSDAWKAYMRRQTNTINWSNKLPLAQGIKFDIK